MSQGCLLSAALKQLQLKMLSEVWILTKLTPLRSARHSSTTEQEVAVGLRKLITKKWHGEKELSAAGNGFVFGGTNSDACAASLCWMAMSPGTWIHIKLYWKLQGVESSLIALAAQRHFSIPCVPLLANTLIITGFGKVHSQELLVMDSTQSSIPYLVLSE